MLDLVASELAELSDAGAMLAQLQAALPPPNAGPGGAPTPGAAAQQH